MEPFRNEPFTDFRIGEEKQAFERALETVRSQLGRSYPLWIGGQAEWSDDRWIDSYNPASPEQLIGRVAQADASQMIRAVESSDKVRHKWSTISVMERIRILYKAASIMRRRKHELSAWLVVESGKSWVEADGETAEAIDFLEYYGREMERLSDWRPLISLPGEENEWRYVSLGTGIVISPWNFPLAIMAGMTSAALVCGNPVVLKPASLTPVVAAVWIQMMHEAGLPPEVLQFVPGPGRAIGDLLVDHPRTRFVCFTGSRDVGVRMYERSAKVHPGQVWLKRAIMELGGKDAIVVDADCDLESAARGIVSSAFGYSGQKCSACSRVMIHHSIYESLADRIVSLTRELVIGNPIQNGTQMGPVIDPVAQQTILRYIEMGKQEANVRFEGETRVELGAYVPPVIFDRAPSNGLLGQQEIFGPVLALHEVGSLKEGIELANGTVYGLTGAVYTRDRENLSFARTTFHVGNLYFNRKCTGALVGVHPFGGFGLSGTDSKAGGPDYLLQFMQGKVISEAF